jgi:predicted RND superfamily exporter protein
MGANMDFKNLNLEKKIKRKNFFMSIGVGLAGFVALTSSPLRLFAKKKVSNKIENTKNSRIKINPSAVSRKNIGGNNV